MMHIRCPKKCICAVAFIFCIFAAAFLFRPVAANAATPEVKLNVTSKLLVKDKSYSLKIYNLQEGETVSFKSSDDAIASVDSDGLVTAKAIGSAVITATVSNSEKAVAELQCDITVGPPAISVKFTRSVYYILEGNKITLTTILQPLNTAESIKFSSSNPSVATISAGGRVTARSLGMTFVFAALDNGKYTFSVVVVVDEETYLKLLDNPGIELDLSAYTEDVTEDYNTGSDVLPDETGAVTDNASNSNTVSEETTTDEALTLKSVQ